MDLQKIQFLQKKIIRTTNNGPYLTLGAHIIISMPIKIEIDANSFCFTSCRDFQNDNINWRGFRCSALQRRSAQ